MRWGTVREQLLGQREKSDRTASSPPRYVCFGDFHLDLQRRELFKNESRVKLQGKVFQALVVLLEKPGEVVTREALSSRLWSLGTHVNYDANVNTTVNKLRQVLGDSPEQPAFVETIPRRGYCFIAKVEFVETPSRGKSPRGDAALPSSNLAPPLAPPAALPGSQAARMWLALGMITLVAAGILFGAAIAVYFHRAIW